MVRKAFHYFSQIYMAHTQFFHSSILVNKSMRINTSCAILITFMVCLLKSNMNYMVMILTTMASLWQFVVWGINLIGQLPKGRGSVQYAVVAVDYFTKWVEAKALASIMLEKLKSSCTKSSVNMECHTLSYQTMTNSYTVTNSRSSTTTYRSIRCFF